MRVLVTGATGFIGSHATRALLARGHEVHALVRPASDLSRIADMAGSLVIVPGDLRDAEGLGAALDAVRPEACVHVAWYAVPGAYLEALENIEMLEAGLRLMRLLPRVGCRTLLAVGTCFEYDTDFGWLSEATPIRPRSLYAASKLALHLAATRWARVTGLRVVWPRIFYQFGAWEHERRLVPAAVLALLRGEKFRTTAGARIRDYLDVEDVGAALAHILESDLDGAVNVGAGAPVAIRTIVETIAHELGRPELLDISSEPGDGTDPEFICADTRLLRARTSWAPRFTLEEGLRRAVDWWRRRTGGKA
jgi:nucleoside-diphosphate-sugar epimerase